MELAATFLMSVYGLAAMSGGILAWAEQTPSVNTLTVPVALCALMLNERHRVLRLDAFWSGIIGIAAFIFPVIEILSGNEESRLLAGAHLLTILQWVLLFHKKSAHQYWWICAISCLQIALASVLTSSPLFGLLILVYMFWALWTLSVFTLLLARLRYGQDVESTVTAGGWEWPKLDEAVRPQAPRPLAGQQSTHSEYRSSFQCDPQETDINWRFVFGVGGMSATALLLGLLFFLLTPRVWIGASNPFQDTALQGNYRNTGFSEKVQLGDFGRILESSAPVLELNLADEISGRPIPLEQYLEQIGQPVALLRGTVLSAYRRGEWWQAGPASPTIFNKSPIYSRGERRQYVRQTIRLEPTGSRTLFSLLDPEYGFIDDQMGDIRVIQDSRSLQYRPSGGVFRGAIRYHLLIPRRTVPKNPLGPQYQVRRYPATIPAMADPEEQAKLRERLNRPVDPMYLECSTDYKVIHELASRLLATTPKTFGAAAPTHSQIARHIVAHLRDSGEYQYTLDQSRIDRLLDPVEDFLKNRKAGHCQYYATALALLLRSSGIPSRVITGFKGGIEAADVGLLEVQQRHAHAWVEAYLDDAWVTLDATPASRDDLVDEIGQRVRWYHHIYTFVAGLWNDYVLNLSFSKQQRDLYAPLQSLGKSVSSQFGGTTGFVQMVSQNLRMLREHPERWFSLRGGITAFLLMLSVLGTFYLLRMIVRLTWRLVLGPVSKQSGHSLIEFYEQFLQLMKRAKLIPKPHQTQLEFAQQVESAWLAAGLPADLEWLAREISLAFYRLRFGEESLSAEQEETLRTGLLALEAHLRQTDHGK